MDAIPAELGKPRASALDNGYFSLRNIDGLEARDIDAYIAAGREPHHKSRQEHVAEQPASPPEDASPIVKMPTSFKRTLGH